MTLTKEDLQAIAELLDEKLEEKLEEKLDEKLDKKFEEKLRPIYAEAGSMKTEMCSMKNEICSIKGEISDIKAEMDDMKERIIYLELKQDLTHKKLDDLKLDVQISERSIRKDIRKLQDAQETIVTVLEARNILPAAK